MPRGGKRAGAGRPRKHAPEAKSRGGKRPGAGRPRELSPAHRLILGAYFETLWQRRIAREERRALQAHRESTHPGLEALHQIQGDLQSLHPQWRRGLRARELIGDAQGWAEGDFGVGRVFHLRTRPYATLNAFRIRLARWIS